MDTLSPSTERSEFRELDEAFRYIMNDRYPIRWDKVNYVFKHSGNLPYKDVKALQERFWYLEGKKKDVWQS